MLSLRQSLATIGKRPPIRIPRDVLMPCKSLRDTLIVWNKCHYDLLIITPQEFVEAVRPLADHKNHTGIATMIRSLEHICQSYSGRDEAEKIKRCLALFQPENNVGLRYAMLLGDEDKCPVRYVKWTHNPDEALKDFRTNFIITDLYYAALFKDSDGSFDDWDGNRNGYFGEMDLHYDKFPPTADPINPDNVSTIPQIAVGRVPASTRHEVSRYVNKVKNYEMNAYGSSWAKTVLLLATTDWIKEGCQRYEDIAAKYLQDFIVHRLYQEGNPCQATETLCPDTINAYMNEEGVGFVMYVGHGSPNSFAIPNGSYDRSCVVKLSNSDKLPVVLAASCDTGQFGPLPPQAAYRDVNGKAHLGTANGEVFDAMPPQPACIQIRDASESMAEAMTVMNDAGAVAYLGSAFMAGLQLVDIQEFFFKAIHAGHKTLGEIWCESIRDYYKKYISPEPSTPANQVDWAQLDAFVMPWRFCLFGDPSLRVGGIH